MFSVFFCFHQQLITSETFLGASAIPCPRKNFGHKILSGYQQRLGMSSKTYITACSISFRLPIVAELDRGKRKLGYHTISLLWIFFVFNNVNWLWKTSCHDGRVADKASCVIQMHRYSSLTLKVSCILADTHDPGRCFCEERHPW